MFLFNPGPFNAEIVARTGLDWVIVDLEHGAADASDLVAMTMAISGAGATPLVRVESGERIRVGRALDLGARGVMVPQVQTVEAAREVATWMRAQPAGARGVALFTRGNDYGAGGHDAVIAAHEELLGIVQIESPQAVEAAAEMAAIEGVDVLFIGPADLSHSMGIPGQIEHPDFEVATRTVAESAREAGVAAGILVWNPEDVGRYARMGYTFFALATEVTTLDRAAREALASAREAAAAVTATEVV